MTANSVSHLQTAAPATYRARSNWVFAALVLVSAVLSGLSLFLPQGFSTPGAPAADAAAAQYPAPLPVMALAAFGIIAVAYGGLGAAGLVLSRHLGLPDVIDPSVTKRQRYLLPLLYGAGLALFLIAADLIFATFNGIGRFPHPPFPTSIVASYTAGVNEEIMFRLFYISLFTWLIAKVLLRGRGQGPVYWIVSVFAAMAFSAGHLPSVMYLLGATSIDAIPTGLLVEIFLLNGSIGMVFAYLLKRFGFLAAAGAHFWTDIVWHVLWGLVG